MDGIQYVVDEGGHRKAVVIDLAVHGELWEDVYDAYMVEARRREPTEPIEDVIRRLEDRAPLDE